MIIIRSEIAPGDLHVAYTTEKDLLEQEAENTLDIDAEWPRRIDRIG